MTLTYRRDLSRRLTITEMDGNLDHLLSSANSSFTQSGIASAVTRTMAAKASEVKSLRDFGCTGTGTTDDTTAVQLGFTWLSGALYRKLVGVDGDIYKITAKINVDYEYFNFDGNNCAFLNAISATPADPAFEVNDTVTVFGRFANFRLYAAVASTKGHGFAIIGQSGGSNLNPQAITFDNVQIDNMGGSGKDYLGASMNAHAVYIKYGQTVAFHNCYFQDCSGGIRAENTYKIHIWHTIIDECTHHGLYADTVDDVLVDGISIVNGCGANGEGAVQFDAVQSFRYVNSRIKGGAGNLIRSGDVLSRGVALENNQLEHTDPTNQAIRLTTAVVSPVIRGGVLKMIPSSGTTQTTGIEIVDVSGGGQISNSGVIEDLYIYTPGSNTLTNGIKLNSTLNSINSWRITGGRIGALTGDHVASVITNAINLAGNGTGVRIEDVAIGAGGGGSVTNGIVIGSGHTSTVVDNNRDDGNVGTMITNSGARSRIRQDSSWTPTPTFATAGNVAFTPTIQLGRYTQEDNYGTLEFNLAGTITHTTAAGNLRITGMPFTPENINSFPPGGMIWSGITMAVAGYTQIVPYAQPNITYIEFQASGTGKADVSVAFGDIPSGGTLRLFGSMRFRLK